ncbi:MULTISPECIES: DUF6735 family protein [Halorussus]|uniref:DUF6735 family protein n=1 Tax=Halorussus TaxID=1070314 RepID=UPI000E218956|nr:MULTISPECIES: DUF6735 family protein [Halorussus]NHN57569.1 hypothetical protein [Halorussus sp. JP-T4]
MGHRALLAYRRDETDGTDETGEAIETDGTDENDGCDESTVADETTAPAADATYDLHRSHWGAADFALADHISAASPFAADTAFAVDPDPVMTGVTLADAAANYVDFLHHEAFYVVDADYETTPYHVLWFGLDADSEAVDRSETVGHGALVEVWNDADFLRGWFRGTKGVAGEMVDRGALSPEEAADYLAARVRAWAGEREVFVAE